MGPGSRGHSRALQGPSIPCVLLVPAGRVPSVAGGPAKAGRFAPSHRPGSEHQPSPGWRPGAPSASVGPCPCPTLLWSLTSGCTSGLGVGPPLLLPVLDTSAEGGASSSGTPGNLEAGGCSGLPGTNTWWCLCTHPDSPGRPWAVEVERAGPCAGDGPSPAPPGVSPAFLLVSAIPCAAGHGFCDGSVYALRAQFGAPLGTQNLLRD